MAVTLFDTTRFGSVGYTETDVVEFDAGLIGFPEHRRFLLLAAPDAPKFRWLQSLDEPQLAFLVSDPDEWITGYAPTISEAEAEALGLGPDTPRLLLTTVSIPHCRPGEMTLNLVAPILVNLAARTGRQLVLPDETYTTKHRVFGRAEAA